MGPCNGTSNRSWWLQQRSYYDSAVNRLMVGDAPVEYPQCPGRAVTHEVSAIPRGSVGYFTAFYRDQVGGQVSEYRIRRPAGTVFESWSASVPAGVHYAGSYWWWNWSIRPNAPLGTWTFEVDFEGETYSQPFTVVE
jgi:hypothetical protein